MTMQRFISKAPANTMLLGEHSVVYGQPALACALDQWIEIEWQQREDQKVLIFSEIAQHTCDLQQLEIHPKLRFIGLALKHFQSALLQLGHGWELRVLSEFPSTIGLGSSAAVLAATLAGLNQITKSKLSKLELWQIGKEIIVEIQGRGSATDLAASLFGGVVFIQPPTEKQALKIESLPVNMDILLVYSGYKTPTAEVLEIVAQNWKAQPEMLDALYREMGQITQGAYHALTEHNWPVFYHSFEQYQSLMERLGVSDMTLDFLIAQLRACPLVWASKISGSGLGDCVLAIGEVYSKHRPQREKKPLLHECPEPEVVKNYLQLQLPISPIGTHIKNEPVQQA
ncbi:mevalonate kinase [Thiomicrorhabdus xiamenensis]|uniref:GHMP kinase n=1 Tax=Thiomicrorhabdus xiamenensis TaxID=2739063 RepID=A0A7D4TFA0_9GAMM|nr:GHMP kinase [Thiomicrorhabdus xiamenensis]QKI88668.1 GHMP kinase [Thiomicrorhabdus xiamenensis]